MSKEAARNISSVLDITLQKYNSYIAELEKEVKTSKSLLNKKILELEECSKEKSTLKTNIAELSRQLGNIDDVLKQKIIENNKFQDHLDSLKEDLYRTQHQNSDLNACVS